MDRLSNDVRKSRFSAYAVGLVGVIGHADQAVPLRDYGLGLPMPRERKSGERKSVERMTASAGMSSAWISTSIRRWTLIS